MARIPEETIERIKNAANIVDVVGAFIDLRKRGVSYEGLCPFHDDHHQGNFKVSPSKNVATCFACGWSGDSIKFLMQYCHYSYRDALGWLANRYNIYLDECERFDYEPPKPRPAPLPMITLELPFDMVLARQHTENNTLCNWLRSLPWNDEQAARIEEVLDAYHIGTSKAGHTIFWQIDNKGGVRTGKMMKYKPDGHRDKEARWNFDYVHSTLIRKYNDKGESVYEKPWPYPHIFNPDTHEMKQTLFGMHLLSKYPTATVNIVESEKTALIMAIAYGNNEHDLWMACGGKENIDRYKMAPIIESNHNIVLYPDLDGIDQWQAVADRLEYPNIRIDTSILTTQWKPEDGDKADIADIITRELMTNGPIRLNNDNGKG